MQEQARLLNEREVGLSARAMGWSGRVHGETTSLDVPSPPWRGICEPTEIGLACVRDRHLSFVEAVPGRWVTAARAGDGICPGLLRRNQPALRPLNTDRWSYRVFQSAPDLLDQQRPGLVVYNAGVEPHRDDRLGFLCPSLEGLAGRRPTGAPLLCTPQHPDCHRVAAGCRLLVW